MTITLPYLEEGRDLQLEIFSYSLAGPTSRIFYDGEEQGVKFGGDGIKNDISSVLECEEVCEDTPACVAWNWFVEGKCDLKSEFKAIAFTPLISTSAAKGTCYLKRILLSKPQSNHNIS